MEENKTIQTILKNGYQFELKDYIKSGFTLYRTSVLSYMIFTFIIMFATEQILVIPSLAGILFVLLSPLQFGYFIFAEKVYKQQQPNFKYFFDGFQRLIPIAILYILNVAIFMLIFFLFFIPIAQSPDIQNFKNFIINNPNILNETKLPDLPVISMQTRIVFFIMIITFLYVTVLLSLAPYFLWFQQVSPFKAMALSIMVVKKRFSRWILFVSVLLLLNILGLLAFGVGIFITMPISFLSFYVAYEKVIGSAQSY